MRIVIMSGGSEKRKWPLTGGAIARQYIACLQGERGDAESTLQRLWRQLNEAGLGAQACIAACPQHAAAVAESAGEHAVVLIEPAQRGTFAAAALAAVRFHSEWGLPDNEAIVVLPADLYGEDAFIRWLHTVPAAFERQDGPLLLAFVDPMARGNGGFQIFNMAYMLEQLRRIDFPLNVERPGEPYWRLPRLSLAQAALQANNGAGAARLQASAGPADGCWRRIDSGMALACFGQAASVEDWGGFSRFASGAQF